MRRRTRLLAGMFALVALAFSFAETVLASTCAPAMGMENSKVVETHATADDCMFAGSHDREHRDTGEDERHCPFGPAVAGCSAVASFPSHVTSEFVPHLHDDRAAFSEPSGRNLLLANAPFHPPRA